MICAYKESPFLESVIESLKAQTVRGKMFLSTSTPNEYLEDICTRHGLEMTINPRPGLIGDDWNHGYDHASTPLVTIVHQDDYYDPHYLEVFLKYVNSYKPGEVSIVFSDYFELRQNREVHHNTLLRIKRILNFVFRIRPLNRFRFVKRRVLGFGCSICCPTVMYIKPVLGSTVFDTTFKQGLDYKIAVDLASRKGRFVYIPKRLVGHRIHEESTTSLNIRDNTKKKEDEEILSMLWPTFMVRIIAHFYAKSEKSNEL